MNKNKINLAISISIALGIFTSSAFAVNNNINPLTGSPSPSNSSVSLNSSSGIQVDTPQSSSLTDNNTVKTDSDSSVSSTPKDEDSKDDSYTYENEEANLKKASNLRVQLTLLNLENEIKTQKDALKTDNSKTQNQNVINQNNPNNNQQQTPNNNQQAPAPVPVYETIQTKTPAIKATAVYGLGSDLFAEIYFGDNKYVISVGSVLPNGYKLVSANIYGVTLRKGKTKIELPIVPIPRTGDNVNISTQRRLVDPNTPNSSSLNQSTMQQPQSMNNVTSGQQNLYR